MPAPSTDPLLERAAPHGQAPVSDAARRRGVFAAVIGNALDSMIP